LFELIAVAWLEVPPSVPRSTGPFWAMAHGTNTSGAGSEKALELNFISSFFSGGSVSVDLYQQKCYYKESSADREV
jgi:hypothetical protein